MKWWEHGLMLSIEKQKANLIFDDTGADSGGCVINYKRI